MSVVALRSTLCAVLLLASCSAPDGATQYFAVGAFRCEFDDTGEFDAFYRRCFSAVLDSMGEPVLSAKRPVIRLLYLPSFDPSIAVRIEPGDGALAVAVTALRAPLEFGEGDRPLPGKVGRERRFVVRGDRWGELLDAVRDSGFWDAPPLSESEVFTWGGSTWVLEVSDGLRYAVVQRISPGARRPHAAFLELGRRLLRLAEIEVLPHP